MASFPHERLSDASIVEELRSRFPALERRGRGGGRCVFLDGPAGTQVPQSVASAVADYLLRSNANSHGVFATSVETDELVMHARAALADFLQVDDADCLVFGPNMTTLTMSLSRAIARTWSPGDEIVVTQLDHDANVAPWLLAARDAGVEVKQVPMDLDHCELNLRAFEELLSPRTKLVALGVASNAVGTVNPIERMIELAHGVGALVYLDAVHWAPHGRVDIRRWQADFLVCSAYKFCGPHVGVLWGRRELLESMEPYKVRPAPREIPDCWMTGTQAFELIAGTLAAVSYFAELGRKVAGNAQLDRSAALDAALSWIRSYEHGLLQQLLAGLCANPEVRILGRSSDSGLANRVPTVSITHRKYSATELARRLAERDVFVWNGNYYAYNWSRALDLPADGAVRIGAVHYNTSAEIEHLVRVLSELS